MSITTLADLKAYVQYPLPSDFFSAVMLGRGLDGDAECTRDVMASAPFKGAMADCLRQLVLYPQSITEGNMTISKADRQSLINEASRLYRSIGEAGIDDNPRITFC